MPGNYKASVIFPFDFDGAKNARIQIEPFVCAYCYGMTVKVIMELVGSCGKKKFNYERVAIEESVTQENIRDGFMSAPFIEVMEGFYYNKTDVNVLVPVCAMILKMYFRDILDNFKINIDQFIIDVEYIREEIGFKTKVADNVSNNQTNKSSYKKTEAISPYSNTGNDKEKDKLSCKEIIQAIQRKDKRSKIGS